MSKTKQGTQSADRTLLMKPIFFDVNESALIPFFVNLIKMESNDAC